MNATIRSLNWDRYRRGRRDSSWTGVGQSVGNSADCLVLAPHGSSTDVSSHSVLPGALLLEAFFDKGCETCR